MHIDDVYKPTFPSKVVCSKHVCKKRKTEKSEYTLIITVYTIGSMYGIFTYIYHKTQPFM